MKVVKQFRHFSSWLIRRAASKTGSSVRRTVIPSTAALRRLSAATDKPLAVCVQGDRLHVFVTNRILGQKVSSRVPPSAAVAEVDFLPELDGILKASDALV